LKLIGKEKEIVDIKKLEGVLKEEELQV